MTSESNNQLIVEKLKELEENIILSWCGSQDCDQCPFHIIKNDDEFCCLEDIIKMIPINITQIKER